MPGSETYLNSHVSPLRQGGHRVCLALPCGDGGSEYSSHDPSYNSALPTKQTPFHLRTTRSTPWLLSNTPGCTRRPGRPAKLLERARLAGVIKRGAASVAIRTTDGPRPTKCGKGPGTEEEDPSSFRGCRTMWLREYDREWVAASSVLLLSVQ
ncbi:jg11925 [Pararge aegeria aegeria]|uniref:Jg11925 protein n=1 Tax=Pararge aegeria aegeria TaxID=348720 RepID=A0A8S4SB68_9NEOP|nr:jg11925 [Pararge aegeria aegeria]